MFLNTRWTTGKSRCTSVPTRMLRLIRLKRSTLLPTWWWLSDWTVVCVFIPSAYTEKAVPLSALIVWKSLPPNGSGFPSFLDKTQAFALFRLISLWHRSSSWGSRWLMQWILSDRQIRLVQFLLRFMWVTDDTSCGIQPELLLFSTKLRPCVLWGCKYRQGC